MENQRVADIPIVQGEHPRRSGNTQLGTVRVEPIPPGPARAPIEVTFRLDLSGVLHVRAQHLPSGVAADVRIADSPYGLTQQRREKARAEVERMRAEAPAPVEGLSDSDLSLATAMLARARRALENGVGESSGAGEARERVRAASDALSEAVAGRDPRAMELCDALSDALLDLV
jgi:molecular chaperone DnaK (HSP70)